MERLLKGEIGKTRKKLTDEQLILFLRQFSVLVQASLPIDRIFGLMAESGTHEAVRRVSEKLCDSLRAGALISEAMRATDAFPSLLISMVETGEQSGSLAEVLSRYGSALEQDRHIRKKVQTAFVYPVLLTCVSVAVVVFLLLNVLPSFAELFQRSRVVLPLPTRLLMGLSQVVSQWGGFVLAMFALTTAGLWLYGSQNGGLRKDRWLDRMPFLGSLRKDRHAVQLASLMALYYESNNDVLRFLRILENGIQNKNASEALSFVAHALERGSSVAEAFHKSGYYPPIFVGMLRTGEEAGRLSEVMDSIASYMKMETEIKLTRRISFLEPVLILTLSFMVGFIVLAIALPMFEMVHLYEV